MQVLEKFGQRALRHSKANNYSRDELSLFGNAIAAARVVSGSGNSILHESQHRFYKHSTISRNITYINVRTKKITRHLLSLFLSFPA